MEKQCIRLTILHKLLFLVLQSHSSWFEKYIQDTAILFIVEFDPITPAALSLWECESVAILLSFLLVPSVCWLNECSTAQKVAKKNIITVLLIYN